MSTVTIDQAIRQRWTDHNLDALFKQYWRDPAATGVMPFNHGEARANTPMPYCVYEKMGGIRTGGTTGSGCEPSIQIEYFTVPIQFSVYAANPLRTSIHAGRTGREIAALLIGQGEPDGFGIIKAFEDRAGRLELTGNDRHVRTETGPDYDRRMDDDVWMWMVMFDVKIERRQKIRGVG